MQIDHFETWEDYLHNSQASSAQSKKRSTKEFAGGSSPYSPQQYSLKAQPQLTLSLNDLGLKIDFKAPFMSNKRPPEPSGRLWGLWEYEVLEVFLAGAHDEYLELEFGPYEHYLALYFRGERHLINEMLELNSLSFWHEEIFWGGSCLLAYHNLPPSFTDLGQETTVDHISGQEGNDSKDRVILGINAFWCFQDRLGKRKYCCAFPLPGASPDFHQPQQFPKYTLAKPKPTLHKQKYES